LIYTYRSNSVDDIVEQVSGLHASNAVYFVSLIVSTVFLAYVQPSVTSSLVWLVGALLLCVTGALKLYVNSGSLKDAIKSPFGEAIEFELIFVSLNMMTTWAVMHALVSIPGLHSMVMFFYSFLPALMILMITPLTWNKKYGAFTKSSMIVEWLLLAFVFIWSVQAVGYLIEQRAWPLIVVNAALLATPAFLKRVKKNQLDRITTSLRKEIYTDVLTGSSNRRAFYDDYDKIRKMASVTKDKGLALIYFDIDYFKQFNDSYGHNEGDACLVHVAGESAELFFPFGMKLYRVGGEEFVLMGRMSETEWLSFLKSKWINLWRSSKWAFSVEHNESPFGMVTVSGGAIFASSTDVSGSHAEALLKKADKMLYAAKNNGRATLFLEGEA
jgi:diguanylate cyclase (GGDEF)-like protein